MRKCKISFIRNKECIIKEGLFHCWGLEGDQEGYYSVGIIELEDGTIEIAHPTAITFVKQDKGLPGNYFNL